MALLLVCYTAIFSIVTQTINLLSLYWLFTTVPKIGTQDNCVRSFTRSEKGLDELLNHHNGRLDT